VVVVIRTPFQRQVRHLLRQMTAAEFGQYRTLRAQGLDWADALTLGVTLPDIATTLAAFQATGQFTRH
jgi:hypothetical protein